MNEWMNEWINSYFDVTSSEERFMRENFYDYMRKNSSRNKIMF
jgi:hypothetical protein